MVRLLKEQLTNATLAQDLVDAKCECDRWIVDEE